MSLNNDSADLEQWSPQSPAPAGISIQNLRKQRINQVRIELRAPNRARNKFLLTVGCAIPLIAAGYFTGYLAAALVASVAMISCTVLWLHDSEPANWSIAINPKMLDLLTWRWWGGVRRKVCISFESFEDISIEQNKRTGRRQLVITTNSATYSMGAGLSQDALKWLMNYLVLEFSGLTWRPIQTRSDQSNVSKAPAIAPNPVMLKPDLAIRLIDIFMAQAPDVIRKIRQAVDANDATEIRRHAHWLKTACASVGARQLSEMCQIMENCAIDRDTANCPVLCQAIDQKMPQIKTWLQEIRANATEAAIVRSLALNGLHNGIGASANEMEQNTIQRLKARVLVVDDSMVSREIAMEFLSDFVTGVSFAIDGEEAVSKYVAGEFDLIFMDCEMERMDGFEAARQIRRHEKSAGLRRVAIVALTGNAGKNDREKCLAAGMDDYITKPYPPEALKQALDKWLAHREAVDALNLAHGQMKLASGAKVQAQVIAHRQTGT